MSPNLLAQAPNRPSRARTLGAAACGALGLASVSLAFWRLDLRYALPTPVPTDLLAVAQGDAACLPAGIVPSGDRPVLLHFFNPQCPCSRFNLQHLRELTRRFETRVHVVVVVEAEAEADGAADVDESSLEGLGRVVLDKDGSIASAVGVYSTPQAVLLDAQGRFLWRGNYNVSRYCVTPATEFVRLALESLCDGGREFPTDPRALVAWGCALPTSEEPR